MSVWKAKLFNAFNNFFKIQSLLNDIILINDSITPPKVLNKEASN